MAEERESPEAEITSEVDEIELDLSLGLPNSRKPPHKSTHFVAVSEDLNLNLNGRIVSDSQVVQRKEAKRKREEKWREKNAQNDVVVDWERRETSEINFSHRYHKTTSSGARMGWTLGLGLGFGPYIMPEKDSGDGRDGGEGGGGNRGSVSSGSMGSSSGISDYLSSSGQAGSSNEAGSHSSNNSQPKPHPPLTPTQPQPSYSPPHPQHQPNICIPQLLISSNTTPVTQSPPPKPQALGHKKHVPSPMPRVSTTGNGPNGKTITGILYRYMKGEVSIVCACHGMAFSPTGFVEHAGGVDVQHPLRQIGVAPFASLS